VPRKTRQRREGCCVDTPRYGGYSRVVPPARVANPPALTETDPFAQAEPLRKNQGRTGLRVNQSRPHRGCQAAGDRQGRG
jgi:hypothetical protein